ncbi:hypothetical protein QMA67_13300 [Gluconobacter japonicus]|nr:hypothetical protein [Gluconobacter japonicus]MDI6653902.1 hypothetical protein [Gluconobacter japonicus]
MVFSGSAGTEVKRHLATIVIGDPVSSTLLTLLMHIFSRRSPSNREAGCLKSHKGGIPGFGGDIPPFKRLWIFLQVWGRCRLRQCSPYFYISR